MAGLPALGLINQSQLANLAGATTINREMGVMRGKRLIAAAPRRLPVRPAMKAFLSWLREKVSQESRFRCLAQVAV